MRVFQGEEFPPGLRFPCVYTDRPAADLAQIYADKLMYYPVVITLEFRGKMKAPRDVEEPNNAMAVWPVRVEKLKALSSLENIGNLMGRPPAGRKFT